MLKEDYFIAFVVLLTILLVVYVVLWETNKYPGTILYHQTIISMFVALGTFFMAKKTYDSIQENQKYRREQFRPLICLSLEREKPGSDNVIIKVTNVGNRSARRVKFTLMSDITFSIFGRRKKMSKMDFIKKGIAYMPPNTVRIWDFFHISDNENLVSGRGIYSIEVNYLDSLNNEFKDTIDFSFKELK